MFLVKRYSDGATFPDFQEKADGDTLLKNAIRGGWGVSADLYVVDVKDDLWHAEREAWEARAKADAAAAEEAERARQQELTERVGMKLLALGFEEDEIGHLLGGAALEVLIEAIK